MDILFLIPLSLIVLFGLAFLILALMESDGYGPFVALALILILGGVLIYFFGWEILIFMGMLAAKPVCQCVCICKHD